MLDDKNVITELMDQVYQFSRIYWKSISQQSLPVTTRYPEMVAEIYPYFANGNLQEFHKKNLGFCKIKSMKRILCLSLLFIPSILFAQLSKRDSLWLTLKPFIGNWKGEGGGEPGKGKYERSYQFILNNRFIEVRNKST